MDFLELKHGSKRTTKLPNKARDVLADHRECHAFEVKQLKSTCNDMSLLSASQKSTPLDASRVVSRSSGVPNYLQHQVSRPQVYLRHAVAPEERRSG